MKIKKDNYGVKKFKDLSGGTCFTLDPYTINEIYIKVNENAIQFIDTLQYSAVNLITGEIKIMRMDKDVYLYENAEVIVK